MLTAKYIVHVFQFNIWPSAAVNVFEEQNYSKMQKYEIYLKVKGNYAMKFIVEKGFDFKIQMLQIKNCKM